MKNMNVQKRLFIAIDLPHDVKKYLYDVALNLNNRDKDIRAIPPGSIHITLKFLGDTNISKIDKIAEAMKNAAGDFQRFSYEIGKSLEAFPAAESARIVFVPVLEGSDKIAGIYKNLENNLSRIKIPKENRKFISHITIARIRNKKNISEILKDIELDYKNQHKCTKITLFESRLKPDGAEYIITCEAGLK
jgi:2'-5' RNA ligase